MGLQLCAREAPSNRPCALWSESAHTTTTDCAATGSRERKTTAGSSSASVRASVGLSRAKILSGRVRHPENRLSGLEYGEAPLLLEFL